MTVPTSIDYSMDADFDAVLRRRTTFSRLMRPDVTADEPFLSTFYVSSEKSDQREKSNEEDVFRHVYIDIKARRAYFEAKCLDCDLPEANYFYHDHVKFQAGGGYQRHLTTEPIVARRLRGCEEGSDHTSLVSAEESDEKAASVTVQEDKPQDQHQFSSPADNMAAQLVRSHVEDPYDLVLLSLSEAFSKESPSIGELLSSSETFAEESPSIDEPPLVSTVVFEDECAVSIELVSVIAAKIEAEDIRAFPVEMKEAQPSFNNTFDDDEGVDLSGCSPLLDYFNHEQPLSESVQSSFKKGTDEATATQGGSAANLEAAAGKTFANVITEVMKPAREQAQLLMVGSTVNFEAAGRVFMELIEPAADETGLLINEVTGSLPSDKAQFICV